MTSFRLWGRRVKTAAFGRRIRIVCGHDETEFDVIFGDRAGMVASQFSRTLQ